MSFRAVAMRVFLLPGYALDSRAFTRLELPDPPFKRVDFIPLQPGDTITTYAARLADEIGFRPDDIIGGLSFGGMLSLEIARLRGARKVLLMSSCSHFGDIRPFFRFAAHFAPVIPVRVAKSAYPLVVMALKFKKVFASNSESLLYNMIGEFPDSLMKGFPRLMLGWKGAAPTCPVLRLHSESDWLIRPPKTATNVTLIPGGHHLISFSHPGWVIRFLYEAAEMDPPEEKAEPVTG